MNEPLQPFMLLRARPSPEIRSAFEAWFRFVHLGDVRRIPGIAQVQSAHTAGGTRLGFYTFASTDVVQAALQSVEAAYARGTWEQWNGNLEELQIEIFAPLTTLPMYRTIN